MEQSSQSPQVLNPHVIRFFSKKDTEFFEIGGKRIIRPSLTASIPSCVIGKTPMVIKGDNLKPIPGMGKMIIIQFIQESTKEMINITSALDINMCCDKCITVIAPEVAQNSVYHVRVGFNCKKLERAILGDKNGFKLDSFVNLEHHHHHHHHHQVSLEGLEMLHHHHHHITDQAQQSQMLNHHHHHHITDQAHIESDSTETLVQITDDSMQIDPKHIDSSNGTGIASEAGVHHIEELIEDIEPLPSEINPYIFESDEHILWSNEIVVAVEVGTGKSHPINQQVLGKRSLSLMTNPVGSTNGGRKKKSRTSKASNANGTSPGKEGNGYEEPDESTLLTGEAIQHLMNGDIEMLKSVLETRSLENRIFYDFERRDEDGFTPLHYSCAYSMNGLVEYLLKNDVDPNKSDKEGWTPLHWSVKANNLVAINLLLSYGADQSVPNHSNQYPVEMAFDKGYTLIAATLQGMSESEYKKQNEPLVQTRDNVHNINLQNLIDNTPASTNQNSNNNNNNNSSTTNKDKDNDSSSNGLVIMDNDSESTTSNNGNVNELKLLSKHGLEPYIMPNNFNIKSMVIEKHNTLKFIQQAERLGLTAQHRACLMDAFKSLRTLRYRLFWIMLSNPLFNKICEWDSNGIDFLVHNKDFLLAVLGLYFGLRGSNSAIDWMSHLARRKCNKSSSSGSGDIWTNLRATTFNLQTNLDKLKDITSEKGEKRKSLTSSGASGPKNGGALITSAPVSQIEEGSPPTSTLSIQSLEDINSQASLDVQDSSMMVAIDKDPQSIGSGSSNSTNGSPMMSATSSTDLMLVSGDHVDNQISLSEHHHHHHHHHHLDVETHHHHHHETEHIHHHEHVHLINQDDQSATTTTTSNSSLNNNEIEDII